MSGRWCVPAGTDPHQGKRELLADEPMSGKDRWIIGLVAAITVIVTLICIAVVYQAIRRHRAATGTTVTITVQDKRADCTTAPPSCTTIYSDAGIFADRDEITAHKLNSKVPFDQLMYGGVYEVQVRGTRHDDLGQYPTITKILKVISQGHPNPATVIPLSA